MNENVFTLDIKYKGMSAKIKVENRCDVINTPEFKYEPDLKILEILDFSDSKNFLIYWAEKDENNLIEFYQLSQEAQRSAILVPLQSRLNRDREFKSKVMCKITEVEVV